jgi:hypothetical protein
MIERHEYINQSQNISNGCKIFQITVKIPAFFIPRPSKYIQSGIACMQVYLLATLLPFQLLIFEEDSQR